MTDSLPSVLTLRQARARGFTDKAVRHRLRSGRWQRPYPRVYVTHSGPIDDETRLAAVLAYSGEDSALSHETAAVRRGLRAIARSVHVTVPEGRRLAKRQGMTVHYSRRWTEGDVSVCQGLRCTRVERTVLDLVNEASSPGRAAGILADAVGSRRTTSERLRLAALDRPNLKHHAAALAVLAETAVGAHSRLELEHAGVLRRHGLPAGGRQKREVLHGRVAYVDHVIEEYAVVTELDGLLNHEGSANLLRDLSRDNANVVMGRAPLRFGWEGVLDQPCEVARQTGAVLLKRGWPGRVTPCSPGCSAAAEAPGPGAGVEPQQPRMAS